MFEHIEDEPRVGSQMNQRIGAKRTHRRTTQRATTRYPSPSATAFVHKINLSRFFHLFRAG